MMEKYQVLEKYFGYTEFREGQETLVDSILSGRDAVGIMPTGAGKSLCFQLPALLLDGVALVVSPLISLMKDQVNALTQAGIPAAYINSSLTPSQFRRALDNARAGEYKILYIAPERLLTEEFLSFARTCEISLVSVDEAHCVSQWGQDFRPSYLKILDFIRALPSRPVVAAFTATATAQVREDIVRILELRSPTLVTTGFDRKNLYFEVQKPRDKFEAVERFLTANPNQSGIIYCATRKAVEEVCERLCSLRYPATRYHAGLSAEERRRNQEDFLYDRCPVMVATNAFGMGIDKSNVSFVLHYNMPKNIESYYQEAGRAGRDGSPAQCILLYGGQDVITNQFLIEHAGENEELDPETAELVRERERIRLKAMTFYCHSSDCLRQYILRYFGEQGEPFCGNCSSCNGEFELEDITIEAQKILSCVKRAGERFGVKMIIDVLRGSENERLVRFGLNRLTTHGILKEVKEPRLRDLIHALVLQGYLRVTDDQYPVLKLTRKAGNVLFQGEPVQMKVVERQEKKSKRVKAQPAGVEHPALFERLKQLRHEIASVQNLPAYIVLTNAALTDMCKRLPTTPAEFLEVSGVGQVKLERYGEQFLSEIRSYLREHEEQ